MALSGCEHCGFVTPEQEPAREGPCPDCGRELRPVTLPVAQELMHERMAAMRFRWRAGFADGDSQRAGAEPATGPSG